MGMYEFETFPNPNPERDYMIRHEVHEFTSLCPKTGQPDFASMTLTYVADKLCIELKSLKLYLQEFRNRGVFYERLTNEILDTLVDALHPREMTLEATFSTRGGIHSVITADYTRSNPLPGELAALATAGEQSSPLERIIARLSALAESANPDDPSAFEAAFSSALSIVREEQKRSLDDDDVPECRSCRRSLQFVGWHCLHCCPRPLLEGK